MVLAYLCTDSGRAGAAVPPGDAQCRILSVGVSDNTNGVVLGVAVQNVSNTQATIPVIIRDDTGTVFSPREPRFHYKPMATPRSCCRRSIPLLATSAGTIEFDTPAGGRISVLGIRTTPLTTNTGVNTLTLTTVPALANIGTNGGSIAHHYNGGRLADHVRIGQHGYKRGAKRR